MEKKGHIYTNFQKHLSSKDGYIKIECLVDYIFYNVRTGQEELEENVGKAEFILIKASESSFGYNCLAYRLTLDI